MFVADHKFAFTCTSQASAKLKLFVQGDALATTSNIAAREWLFRFGIVADLLGAVVLIFLTLALYGLFSGVDRNLAIRVVIFARLDAGAHLLLLAW